MAAVVEVAPLNVVSAADARERYVPYTKTCCPLVARTLCRLRMARRTTYTPMGRAGAVVVPTRARRVSIVRQVRAVPFCLDARHIHVHVQEQFEWW